MKRFTDHPETIFGVLCEHSPDGVLLMDSNANILHVNPTACRMFGYSPDEMQGKNFRMLLFKAADGATITAFAGSAVSDLSLDEVRLKKKTGRALMVDITLSGITIDNDRLAVAFMRDATRRFRLARERRKNEMLLSDVFNAIEGGISLLDRDLTILRTNTWMEKSYRASMPLVGRKCYEAYQQRTTPCPFCPSLTAMKEDRTHEAVVPYPSEEAPEGWYELFAYPFKDLEGNVTGVVEYIRDITQQRQTTEALKQSNRKLQARDRIAQIFLTTPDDQMYGKVLDIVLETLESRYGVFGYIDDDGALVCPSMTRDIWDQCQIPGKDIVFPREAWTGIWSKALTEKVSLFVNTPLHVPEGHLPITRALTVPITFGDEVIGLLTVANRNIDYTEKDKNLLAYIADFIAPILHARLEKQRDERIKARMEEQRVKLETLLNQTSAAIVITDINGTIDYVNPGFEKITGYSAEEARGQNPRILKSGRQDEPFYEALWRTITSGRTWHGQFVNKRKDGSFYHEDAIIFPIKDTSGTIINFAAIKQDITKQVRLEEQLRQAAKLEAIGQLAGGIAHDFNNVLTSIKGFAEIGLSRLQPAAPSWNEFSEILKAGEQATRIASQLLAFSRKQIIAPRALSVNHVLREFEPVLTQLIGEDIDFLFTLCDRGDTIFADRGQVEQCVMNLVINARDAIRQKMGKSQEKKITIETLPVLVGDAYVKEHINIHKGPYVVIAVSDTGIGMDADTLSQVFDPFFTTKETGKGTGLGCSTVFGIVRQNNGNVRVYSEPGVGTTVKIYWPASDKELSLEKPEEEAPEPASVKGTETLLIAEDDEGIRNFVSQALEALGYTVYRAASGAEALKLVEEKGLRPDLLFTDVIMPGMDGTELARALLKRIPRLKIIFSSGYTANHIVHNGLLDTNIHFLHKPYSYRELTKKIREVLDL